MSWWYPVLLWFALPAVWVRLRWRARREPAYGSRQSERFGRVPQGVRTRPIWFHTVSAGETIAAAPLIRQLAQHYPDIPFLVTTMTPTGSEQVQSRLSDVVDHCYAPYDFSFAVERFYRQVQPRMLVLMETELWPNLIAYAERQQIPVCLVNARLSQRSADGYRRISAMTRWMLTRLSLLACQTEAHAQRFIALGAEPERVECTGSVKFDAQLAPGHDDAVAQLRDALNIGERAVWIAASTHPGEEVQVLSAFTELRLQFPELLLILVPRHPARAADVAKLIADSGYTCVNQSGYQPSVKQSQVSDVFLGDVMGTLQTLYGLADVAFIGGSLVPVGGHNPIEPVLCGVPVVCGPQRFNFSTAMDELESCGALFGIEDAQSLARQVAVLLQDDLLSSQAGTAGLAVVDSNRGAQTRLFELLSARIAALT